MKMTCGSILTAESNVINPYNMLTLSVHWECEDEKEIVPALRKFRAQ